MNKNILSPVDTNLAGQRKIEKVVKEKKLWHVTRPNYTEKTLL